MAFLKKDFGQTRQSERVIFAGYGWGRDYRNNLANVAFKLYFPSTRFNECSNFAVSLWRCAGSSPCIKMSKTSARQCFQFTSVRANWSSPSSAVVDFKVELNDHCVWIEPSVLSITWNSVNMIVTHVSSANGSCEMTQVAFYSFPISKWVLIANSRVVLFVQ